MSLSSVDTLTLALKHLVGNVENLVLKHRAIPKKPPVADTKMNFCKHKYNTSIANMFARPRPRGGVSHWLGASDSYSEYA